jgi:eukaryotic-like serine/threonine-protein kinase
MSEPDAERTSSPQEPEGWAAGSLLEADALRCPECGVLIPPERSTEPCWRCLLQCADDSHALPNEIAGYPILSRLGRGAMGTVYLAQQPVSRRQVALKVLREELLDERMLRWFACEIEILAQLEHPNIVPIYDGQGLLHEQPFFVMRYINGSTLDEEVTRRRFEDPRAAAELMIKICGAIQFAHQRGVLHRDIKPSNLLIDNTGEPYVSDFGLARVLHGEDSGEETTVAGTLDYMSPEQALAPLEPTVASDIYALGAVLYDLLTGMPPRRAHDLAHLIESFRTESLTEPRRHAPRVSRTLSRVCMCALEQDPAKRYQSAAEFADDLRRVVVGEPVQPPNAPKPRGAVRAFYWARRHSSLAAAVVPMLLLVVLLPLMLFQRVEDETTRIRARNLELARTQANEVMRQLRIMANRARAMAADPAVAELVAWKDVQDPPEVLRPYAEPLGPTCVFTPDGTLKARYPKPSISKYDNLVFAFRDYFQGQQRITRADEKGVYISRAFFSTGDLRRSFGFSAPIFDGDKKRIGAVLTGISTGSTFGSLDMLCRGQGNCTTVLLGMRDRDSLRETKPSTLSVLAAPGLPNGSDEPVADRFAKQICSRLQCEPSATDQFLPADRSHYVELDDYLDPISGQASVGAFVPVGGTGIIVLVATSKSTLQLLEKSLSDASLTYVGIQVLLSFAIWILLNSARLVHVFSGWTRSARGARE